MMYKAIDDVFVIALGYWCQKYTEIHSKGEGVT